MNIDEPGMGFSSALADEQKWQLKRQNISTAALAGMLQIGQRTIGQWLNGRSKIPFTFVYSASLVMGIRPGSLFELAERRMASSEQLLVTGIPEWREPSTLSPEDLSARSVRFLHCIAAELRTQLAARDLSVRQISLKLGKAPTVAGEWLNGKKIIPVHFAYNICRAIDFPIHELVDRAEARIDLFPEDADERAPESDASPSYAGNHTIKPAEISRRLRALLDMKGMDQQSAYDNVAQRLAADKLSLTRETWNEIIAGDAVAELSTLAAVADALGAPTHYLVTEDEAVTDRAEAEAELARVAAEAGVTNIAARGAQLTPETLREIANLVGRIQSK